MDERTREFQKFHFLAEVHPKSGVGANPSPSYEGHTYEMELRDNTTNTNFKLFIYLVYILCRIGSFYIMIYTIAILL